MNARIRPNLRINWHTCAWCQTDYRGHADTPCPQCAAYPGRPMAWYEHPWRLFWMVMAIALCTVAAVMLLVSVVGR